MCDSRGLLSALSRLTIRASEPRFGSIRAWANRQGKKWRSVFWRVNGDRGQLGQLGRRALIRCSRQRRRDKEQRRRDRGFGL